MECDTRFVASEIYADGIDGSPDTGRDDDERNESDESPFKAQQDCKQEEKPE
jgi:hypothetical protein